MTLSNHFYNFIPTFFLSFINKIGVHNANKSFKNFYICKVKKIQISWNFAFIELYENGIMTKVYQLSIQNLRNRSLLSKVYQGIIHLVRLQNFPNNSIFLPPDTRRHKCMLRGTKCFSKKFGNVLNAWSPNGVLRFPSNIYERAFLRK